MFVIMVDIRSEVFSHIKVKYRKSRFYELCHTFTLTSLGHSGSCLQNESPYFQPSPRIIFCALCDMAFPENQRNQTEQ